MKNERWNTPPPDWTELAPLKDLLARFTYRPGWKFTLDREGAVRVEAMVIDTDDTERVCPLSFRQMPPRHVYDGFPWEKWLFDEIIMKIERHEASEFFKIDGVKVFDPHAGEQNAAAL
jgi:hypothetical protein